MKMCGAFVGRSNALVETTDVMPRVSLFQICESLPTIALEGSILNDNEAHWINHDAQERWMDFISTTRHVRAVSNITVRSATTNLCVLTLSNHIRCNLAIQVDSVLEASAHN